MEQIKDDAIPLLNRQEQEETAGRKSLDTESPARPEWTPVESYRPTPNFYTPRLICVQLVCCLIGIAAITTIAHVYPFCSTIPTFLGIAFIFVSWVVLRWCVILSSTRTRLSPRIIWQAMGSWPRFEVTTRYFFTLSTIFAIWLVFLSVLPVPKFEVPDLSATGDRYFIAINLYNNEDIMPGYTRELEALIEYLGRANVYLSIYESNSIDKTPLMLRDFGRTLEQNDIDHRIISSSSDGRTEFGLGSLERITYLSRIRNKALEPIQSSDGSLRVPEWRTFTKIIFMNDVVYKWQDIARLVGTRLEGHEDEAYDMVCAVDHEGSGSYDTWVGRDICGSPFIKTWPYVKDRQSVQAMRDDRPFELASCWHGAVVLKADPFLYGANLSVATDPTANVTADVPVPSRHHLGKRWEMLDNSTYPESLFSPALTSPLQFRTSGIEDCNHSECFLLPYDLHRMYKDVEGRPRIWMNPSVRLAYDQKLYDWNNVVLRIPIAKWWRDIWSHRIGWYMVHRITERKERGRDGCTWAAFKIPTADGRCPPLPGKPEPEGKTR